MKRVLVTGGAGFVGSHVVSHLLAIGCDVMSFDCLLPQVHPYRPEWPAYQPDHPMLQKYVGDVRVGPNSVLHALQSFKPDTVIHLAAMVGVGQSATSPGAYTSCNITGTMALLDWILQYNAESEAQDSYSLELHSFPLELAEASQKLWELEKTEPEAAYAQAEEITRHQHADLFFDMERLKNSTAATPADAADEWFGRTGGVPILRSHARVFELADDMVKPHLDKLLSDSHGQVEQVFIAGSMSSYGEGAIDDNGWDDQDAVPVPTRENFQLSPTSIYAWTKAQAEQGALLLGKTRGLVVKVGRFFNIYGENQALTNPYTGVAAIFAARCMAGLPPVVYENGTQTRDFIHVSDIVSGIMTILEKGEPFTAYNIGTGIPTSILYLATLISREIAHQTGTDAIAPIVTGLERAGDIRHCFASRARMAGIGWQPKVRIDDGIKELIRWVKEQPAEQKCELLDRAHNELLRMGLLTAYEQVGGEE